MPDIAGSTLTTSTITVGGSASNTLEVLGDHDWFRIELVAGQKITINLDGITLEDSHVYVRDAAGNLLADNDDISAGVVRDSRLVFTATTTGTYYIDVGAFNEAYTGTYQLNVDVYTPPPVATIVQIADHLASGYWGGDSHHFNATQGGAITVNITGLTAAGQTLARAALNTWSEVIGVSFNEVVTGGQITFDDNEEGAFSDGNWSGGITTSAHVNVSTQWLTNYGTSLNGYSFQTYIHEIGHALGLGHGGYYNSTANYESDALFANDGWPTTVMSYFDQQDSSYFANQGFNFNYIVTPMMADILAMSLLYGLSTTTRVGDTTYGPSWTNGMGALCIFDSGGTDTIDVSGFGGSQLIDLTPGSFSNILGEVGNVSIALGVVIENAIGGAGSDQIIGNSADNILNGGAGNDSIASWEGNDLLIGGAGDDALSGMEGFDTVSYADAAAGVTLIGRVVRSTTGNAAGIGEDGLFGIERIIGSQHADTFTGYNLDDEWFTGGLGADRMTGGGGSDTFIDTAAGLNGDTITDLAIGEKIIITNATLAGFTYSLVGSTLTYTGGSLTLTGGVSGQFVAAAAVGGGVQLTLQAVVNDVRNDFNGDGRSDILWRSDAGQLSDWLGQANGGFVGNDANAFTNVPISWQVAGTGDFNGDGRDDILWRNSNGQLSDWLGTANGGFVGNDANALTSAPTNWHVVGTGDFNGDGRDDILWRSDAGQLSDWLGQANGGFVSNDANAFSNVPTNWHVAGTGDFNGDGRDDILWRNDAGQLSNWLGQANGGFVSNDANAFTSAPTNWHVAGTGDFNGDGRDDILWRSDAGQLSNWLGQANGGFVTNDANAFTTVPTSWQVDAIGDYNGDGRDDILWRNTNGQLSDWLGQANGGFISNDANAFTSAPTNWHVQPETFLL